MIPRKVWAIMLAAVTLISLGTGEIACHYVDTEVSSVIYTSGGIPLLWKQTSMEDYARGTATGTDVTSYPGDIMLQPSETGSFTSAVFDTGKAGTIFDHAFWDRILPAGTSIIVEVRANDTLSGGVPNDAWEDLGDGTHASLEGLTGRYVQWRAVLTSEVLGETPVLEEVRLYYRLA